VGKRNGAGPLNGGKGEVVGENGHHKRCLITCQIEGEKKNGKWQGGAHGSHAGGFYSGEEKTHHTTRIGGAQI